MNVANMTDCCNCGCCSNICPQNAIILSEDAQFYTVSVDPKSCIFCGICVKKCLQIHDSHENEVLSAFAGWNKDNQTVLRSSSGGAFHALAEAVIADGGVVFGATYSDNCKRVEICSSDEVSLERLQKSKYVESFVGQSFTRMKTELDKGRKVLFCGTPCQVSGLKSFLNKDYDRLLTLDFSCGGVPSHKVYEQYLSELSHKYKAAVTSVDFRPKTHGWKRYAVKITFSNGKVYNRLGVEDVFLRSFLYSRAIVRDSCLACKFADHHASDITLADFWLHKAISTLDNENGISLILCNTEKGESAFRGVEGNFEFVQLEKTKAAYNNTPNIASEQEIRKRELFMSCFDEHGLTFACNQYLPLSLRKRVRNLIARIIYLKKE